MIPFLIHAVSTFLPAPELPYSEGLRRAITWDSYGAYALDADTPLTPTGQKIVKDLVDSELGRAANRSRNALSQSGNDLVPAWALSQVLRVWKTALHEYQRSVEGRSYQNDSPAMLLFKLQVARIAMEELPILRRRTGDVLFDAIHRDQKALRDRLLPFAPQKLGIAVSLLEVSPFWIVQSRKTMEDYRASHPNGPEIRPLLCRAYLWGLHLGPLDTFLTPKATAPEEPQTAKAYEIAQSLLRERPHDPLGHYYSGVCHFFQKRTDLAVREMKLAIETHELPTHYENLARRFVENPGFRAFTGYKIVY